MPLLPARTLLVDALGVGWKHARHQCLGAEHRGRADGSEVEPKPHVFDDVAGGERCAAYQRPGECHASSHQWARQSEPVIAERAHMVLHGPGEGGDACLQACAFRRMHQVERLHRPIRLRATAREAIEAAGVQLAIGVDDQHNLGWRRLQKANAVVERVALAAQFEVAALRHLGTGGTGHLGRGVAAVVGDDDQAVTGRELLAHALQGSGNARRLVVRGDEHGSAQARCARARGVTALGARRQQRHQHLREQHRSRQHQCGTCQEQRPAQ